MYLVFYPLITGACIKIFHPVLDYYILNDFYWNYAYNISEFEEYFKNNIKLADVYFNRTLINETINFTEQEFINDFLNKKNAYKSLKREGIKQSLYLAKQDLKYDNYYYNNRWYVLVPTVIGIFGLFFTK